MSTIYCGEALYAALRTIITNLPTEHVREVTICVDVQNPPVVLITAYCTEPDGTLLLDVEQKLRSDTRRFRLVPHEEG